MAYENLLKSVEESAQEKERELREKARSAVQLISEDTKNQVNSDTAVASGRSKKGCHH